MHAPFREERKRKFSDMEQVYCGPEEFMEAGVRGFLITTMADKEEFALDDALELLRQASIMIYGGYETHLKKPKQANGYVKINFMDEGDVQILPKPEGMPESEDDEPEEPKKVKKEDESEKQEKDGGEVKEEEEGEKDEEEEEKDEEKEETEEMEEDQEKGEEEEKEDKDKEEEDEEESKDKKKDEKRKEKKKKVFKVMRCQHKFKAFRTELSNTLFIKSDVPDPLELASAAMDLVMRRKFVQGDALQQLVPVYGVCNYDFVQLEIMTQRVLRSTFDENLPPKSYSVMLYDKIAEPGSEQIAETVRNAIWCLNPNCWMASPLTEPDALIRVELIGSKIVLCCMSKFMMYRQYSPNLLVTLGPGCPEDDDGTDMNAEMKREHEEILQRKKDAEERRKKEEEERKRLAAEKRKLDEERRIKKLADKKKREEERLKKEEENKKKREERKKKDEERRKLKEEEKAKQEAEKAKEEEGSAAEVQEAEETEKAAAEDAENSQNLDSSQNQEAMDESTTSQDESGVGAEGEGEEAEPKAKRGRRGRGRGKAKK